MIRKNFGLKKQPLVDAHTNILLIWIIIFLIVFASIPLGLSVGLATVLLTNLLEITDLSLYPEVSPPAKILGSLWIIFFILYFATQVARITEKIDEKGMALGKIFVRPLLIIITYFTLLLVAGIFLRF